jgi:hypothetical protein
MRICVLGNSHVASLKQGLDTMGPSDIAWDFFAAPARTLAGLERKGHKLVATTETLKKTIAYTSGGKTEIDIAAYDAFLVYGLRLRMPVVEQRLSSAVQRQVCIDTLARTLNLRTFSLVRQATQAPIYVGHDPQEARTGEIATAAPGLAYGEVYEIMKAEILSRRASLIRQPQETFHDDWFTKERFSEGSTRLDIGRDPANPFHDEDDNKHMNGDYGRIWLEHFLDASGIRKGA